MGGTHPALQLGAHPGLQLLIAIIVLAGITCLAWDHFQPHRFPPPQERQRDAASITWQCNVCRRIVDSLHIAPSGCCLDCQDIAA